MLRYLLAVFLFFHGLIHLMGFARAFQYGNVQALTHDISKPAGIIWMLTTLLFCTAAGMVWFEKTGWWMPTALAILLSQILIITSWHDARYGTIANIILLLVTLAAVGSFRFEHTYRNDTRQYLKKTDLISAELVTAEDLQLLPDPVRKYLEKAGVLNQPKVTNMKVTMTGAMRERGKDWFTLTASQYNFFTPQSRFFFLKAKQFGITIPGYHRYVNGTASMDIRLFGWFPLVRKKGKELDQAETVTLFNDMCFLAPATLINKNISWETIDTTSVKARFRVKDNSIEARLVFNAEGLLEDFISDDRYEINTKKYLRFATPAGDYHHFNHHFLAHEIQTNWLYPDGWFTYGKFLITDIQYNVST